MSITTIITAILSLLSGGFIGTISMIRINKSKGQKEVQSQHLDNTDKLLDLYEEKIIQPLKEQIEELKHENKKTRKAIAAIVTCEMRLDCPVLHTLMHNREETDTNISSDNK